MSNASAIVLILEKDLKSEEITDIMKAVSLIRGVQTAYPHVPENITQLVAESRVRRELLTQFYDILHKGEKRA